MAWWDALTGWLGDMNWGGLAKTALPYLLKGGFGLGGGRETPSPYFMTPQVNQAQMDLFGRYLPEGMPSFEAPRIPMGDIEAMAYGMGAPTTTPEEMTGAITGAFDPLASQVAETTMAAMRPSLGPKWTHGKLGAVVSKVIADAVTSQAALPKAQALAGVPGRFEAMAAGRLGPQAGLLSNLLQGRGAEAKLGLEAATAPWRYAAPGIAALAGGASRAFGQPQMVQPGEQAKYPWLSDFLGGMLGNRRGGFDWGKLFGGGGSEGGWGDYPFPEQEDPPIY